MEGVLIQLVYVSSSVGLFTPETLQDILAVSRRNNAARSITGMLLYKGGNIVQVLEGPKDAVEALFARIEADQRHAGVICLCRKSITQRDFADWSMGFRDLNSEEVRAMDGYSEFLDTSFDVRTMKPSQALNMLTLFKANLR